jgi:hypothetical protein
VFVDDTFRPANIFKRGNGMWHLTSNFLKHATVFYSMRQEHASHGIVDAHDSRQVLATHDSAGSSSRNPSQVANRVTLCGKPFCEKSIALRF